MEERKVRLLSTGSAIVDRAISARRSTAFIRCVLQDRPDLAMTARVVSPCVWRWQPKARSLASREPLATFRRTGGRRCHTPNRGRRIDVHTVGGPQRWLSPSHVAEATSSATVGGFSARTGVRQTSSRPRGWRLRGELSSHVSGVSEWVGLKSSVRERFAEDQTHDSVCVYVEASACKGMFPRTHFGAECVKHLSTKLRSTWCHAELRLCSADKCLAPRLLRTCSPFPWGSGS